MITATWITRQLVFNGFVTGLVFGLLAMGIVLVFRSTKVINFAVGNLGIVGGALFALMVLDYQFPFWIAFVVAMVVGTLFGAIVELSVIRRLFSSPRVIVLVATVGVAQLAVAIVSAYPDIETTGSKFPVAIGTTWSDVAGLRITGAQLSIIVIVPLVAVALGWLLTRTVFGKAVTASADNPELARLSAVNPKIVSTFVWTIAGFLSTLSIILLGGNSGAVTGFENLGASTLARAMVAAVIAGLASFPRAVIAGVAIGVIEALLRFNFVREPGAIDLVLFVGVIVAIAIQTKSRRDGGVFAFTPKVRPIPTRLRQLWWVRHLGFLTAVAALVTAVVLPVVVTAASRHLLYTTILCFALCATSVTVITGWAGQLSLSQMTFAGLGALLAAAIQRGFEIDVGFVDFQAPPVPFAVAIVLATVAVAVAAAVVGAGALRARGLLLAVATFVFAVAAQQYLYRLPVLSDGNATSVPFTRGALFGLDLSEQRTYYYVCLACLAVALIVLARLRRSGIGRSTIAVRDNPDGAAAYTIGPARTKLSAFALAGGVAALGGALLAGAVQSVPISERFFLVGDSLRLVGMVVIGGLGSLAGAVVGALWIVGLPAFFPGNELVPLFTSSLGLLIIVLYFPGGLIQIGQAVQAATLRFADRRLGGPVSIAARPPVPAALASRTTAPPTSGLALGCHDVTVRFGGNDAVRAVNIEVRSNEIVGLIGTNGAGKSTLMNAIGGFVRSTGVVCLHDRDISGLRPSRRAAQGLGRTFQAATLFPELSVRETVQVALEGRGHTPFLATALGLSPSASVSRAQRAAADDLIAFLGLGRYADSFVSELSTGTRRIVELAGLLALDARLLCLDEPTAGVAQRETEAFGPLLVEIRRELGAAMLVIEHDMPLIMAMSDRVYCLEAGVVIAHGAPAEVRADERVIASYLGTDTRAIARSDSTPAGAAPVAGGDENKQLLPAGMGDAETPR